MTSTASLVDPQSYCSPRAEIYRDANGVRWSFMLNLTDISYGTYGNNKFYTGQLIVDCGRFVVFRKWGRVGAKTPQSKVESYSSADAAEASFNKAFQSKSGNQWPLTKPFARKKGKYFLVELDDGEPDTADDVAAEKVEEKGLVPSKLPQEVQNIVQLICDPDVVTREMASLNVDLKRFPLGKLSKAQISQGYDILQRISTTLEELEGLTKAPTAPEKTTKAGGKGRRQAKAKAKAPAATNTKSVASYRKDLQTLSSEFYSLIPHDFGRSLPPVIATIEDLKLKLELLEVLSNLEISQTLQKQEAEKPRGPAAIHPLDLQYGMLNTDMEPMDKSGKEYKIIEKFIEKTNGGRKLDINTILKIERPDEESHKDVLGSLDNHKLLWHGSRLSNFVGILSQGLRIAPPEAPVNGYYFGKGLYFADALAKSANYCCASTQNPIAILLLADVALGTQYKTPDGEYLDYKTVKNQRGCDSTHGLGRMAPAEDEFETLSDGVVVPAGTLKPVAGNQHLLYSEFIVYRREQVQLRYLVALNLHNLGFGW
ncbi:poly polymerase catalytic domain containing protein [Phytophthora cinnamomi]|uniref:poly polymerase catalytic domain containing protein n=1 Tax=Phytophthora cinnamomi TaxID=4785 RepID=UPI00355A806D|nr:poly polymerase catalytic domain containing protein [Phytophthora cinnamomi]